jgi:hypothetical protein
VCPIIGNAIHVIHKDWECWSKMSKQELMANESGEVVRIQHRIDWFQQVKEELGTPRPPKAGRRSDERIEAKAYTSCYPRKPQSYACTA